LHEDGFSSGVNAARRVSASLADKKSLLGDVSAMSEIDAIIAAAKNQS